MHERLEVLYFIKNVLFKYFLGRFGESIGLVEDCIMSIEKQFGSGIELINELQKLITLLQSDLKQLVDSGLRGSREFR